MSKHLYCSFQISYTYEDLWEKTCSGEYYFNSEEEAFAFVEELKQKREIISIFYTKSIQLI